MQVNSFTIARNRVECLESRRFHASEVCGQWRCEVRQVAASEIRIFDLDALLPISAWVSLDKKTQEK